jgi:hypothetical protein
LAWILLTQLMLLLQKWISIQLIFSGIWK